MFTGFFLKSKILWKHLLIGEWIHDVYSLNRILHTVIKADELVTHSTWISLKNIILRKKNKVRQRVTRNYSIPQRLKICQTYKIYALGDKHMQKYEQMLNYSKQESQGNVFLLLMGVSKQGSPRGLHRGFMAVLWSLDWVLGTYGFCFIFHMPLYA